MPPTPEPRIFQIFWIFEFLRPVLGSGRCPNGEISKFRFRWPSGEPVATFLDPKQAPGHWIVHNADIVICVHRRDCCLCSDQRLLLMFRPEIVACVQTRDCCLFTDQRLLPACRPETVTCVQTRDCCLCTDQRLLPVYRPDISY